MEIGIVGLGKMGYNLAENLLDSQHKVFVFDVNQSAVSELVQKGCVGGRTLKEMIEKMPTPRILWLMVPAGVIVDGVLNEVLPVLCRGDIIIEGGNSNYKDSLRRSAMCEGLGIHFMDVGTSGGMEGARNGACLMIGGDEGVFREIEPIFKDLAVENGYHYAGRAGSGHYLKMVHNGIEYGMMQSIAEGFELLEKSEFDFDYEAVAKVWNNGSVIRSWLVELAERAFSKDAKLDGIKGIMHSSGEGKWTVEEALDLQVATPVIALSLMMRYRSLETDTFHGKVVAALRNEFGGHATVKSDE